MKDFPRLLLLPLLLLAFSLPALELEEGDELFFDDAPLQQPVHYPSWFRLSFLDMREDLREITSVDKRGLIIYFGQEFCPYCRTLLEKDFLRKDIERYTRKNFEVLAIDIHGQRTVTDLKGRTMTEKAYADREKVDFTPTLIFYDKDGIEALRLRGYYPPYKFRAALEFVSDAHYRDETFRDYLQRADPPLAFDLGEMNIEDFFESPPYALDRSRIAAQKPLLVFFEQGNCHACDVLHSAPLQNEELRTLLENFDMVQLDVNSDTPVITPSGERTTTRHWAESLGLFYTPTLMFFDQHGKTITHVDSVAGFYRLQKTLEYVLSGAYKSMPMTRFSRERKDK